MSMQNILRSAWEKMTPYSMALLLDYYNNPNHLQVHGATINTPGSVIEYGP